MKQIYLHYTRGQFYAIAYARIRKMYNQPIDHVSWKRVTSHQVQVEQPP